MHQKLIDLKYKIEQRQARIAIVGLGYVGLPLLCAFGKVGFPILGLDLSQEKIASLNSGHSYIQDIPSEDIQYLNSQAENMFSSDFAWLQKSDIVVICVPTPLRKTKEPDLSYIISASEAIRDHLHQGQMVILESTTYPGTTDEILLPLFESSGLKVGEDFLLVFSPERIDPGNQEFSVETIPKVVGGVTADCGEYGAMFYECIVNKTHKVSSARVAETSKILENTFRSVNIALVNEYANICRVLGIDIWEVIEAAGTKPFGFMKFFPGPGIGGHCIPLDPHYLMWKSRLHGFEPRFMSLADQINSGMPREVVHLISGGLNEMKKPINSSRILLVGVAYKPNVKDARETPATPIAEILLKMGAKLSYYDPFIPSYQVSGTDIESVTGTDKLSQFDCAVILTAHHNIDYAALCQELPLVIDTRNACQDYKEITRIITL